MTFLALSVLAGLLTVLAPCILPLLPIIIGAAGTGGARGGRRALTVIAALAVSVIVFTLLLKASTLLIAIPPQVWPIFSGTVIVALGILTIVPRLWSRVPLIGKIQVRSNKAVGAGHGKNNFWGDVTIGVALGPVFSTCSPTYLFILATVLPASFMTGLVYLFGFTFGMALSLGAVALLGNKLISRITVSEKRMRTIQVIFGTIFVIVGIAIMTGFDKRVETALLDAGIGGTVLFEERLIERARESDVSQDALDMTSDASQDSAQGTTGSVQVPAFLRADFPATSWEEVDPIIERALPGGPGKDGIPAIDDPGFVPISESPQADNVLAIVLRDEDRVNVYPYNILVWHEIVNDVVGDIPVAVTFCPLCGSAIVFDRRLPDGESAFGVSGSLIESNMIMYDRETESLWQQSTGKALAGRYAGTQLKHIPFQLLAMGDVRQRHPDARVLTEDTGFARDYARNPYSGYEESEGFIFAPSPHDATFPSKEIMVVFRTQEIPVAVPWLGLEDGREYVTTIASETVSLRKEDGELSVRDAVGEEIPFYFEMWFSFAVQHGTKGEVFIPEP